MKLRDSIKRDIVIIKQENLTTNSELLRRSIRSKKVIPKDGLLGIKQEGSSNRDIKYKQSHTPSMTSKISYIRSDTFHNSDGIDVEVKHETSIKSEILPNKSAAIDRIFKSSDRAYYYYCSLCKETMTDIKSLWEHRTSIHNIRSKTSIKHVDLEPDVLDSNNYCQSCEMTYMTLRNYRSHLQKVHRMLLRPLRLVQRNDTNANDTDFHCRSCDITFSSEVSFQYHLLAIHPTGPHVREQPDIDDPNYFCRVCKRESASVVAYRKHLRTKHKMVLQPLWMTLYDPTTLPDPFDPNFYCRICKTSKNTLLEYRKHCKSKHRMSLTAVTPFAFPDAVINIDSRDFYCAKCDKHLKSTYTFKNHIRLVHNISPTYHD